MFRAHVLIIGRSKLHYTTSDIITPIGGRLVHETFNEFIPDSPLLTLHSVRYPVIFNSFCSANLGTATNFIKHVYNKHE